MTTVILNSESHHLVPGATLADLLASVGADPDSLATAVNGEFVPRESRAGVVLNEGDAVFTFQPITGG